jgi:DNA-binding MarR family transcriptional regulator
MILTTDDNSSRSEHIKRLHNTAMLAMTVHKRWFVQKLQTYGITVAQFVTLAALVGHSKPSTMSDLTNVTFQDAPTTTGVVDRLVKMELVERTRSQTDRRVVLVEPTPAGESLIQKINADMHHNAIESFATLTNEQLLNFEQLLNHFIRMYLKESIAEDADMDEALQKLNVFIKDAPFCLNLESKAA